MLQHQELTEKPSREDGHKYAKHIEQEKRYSLIVKEEVIPLWNHQLYHDQINRESR